MVEMFPY